MEESLPPEWQCLTGRVRYIRKHPGHWTSSCPRCGGHVHPNGDWPDRFVMWVNRPRAWCRRCGLVAFPDQFGGPRSQRLSEEERYRWEAERREIEERRRAEAERALEVLRRERLWETYHEGMTPEDRAWWRARGVSDRLQDWWKLGAGEYQGHPSATIPLFGSGWKAQQLKHRLRDVEGRGKYRYELSKVPGPLFRCRPDVPLQDEVLAVEGEIKAMVCFAHLRDADRCIVGLPGATPGSYAVEELEGPGRIVLVMDPGAHEQARRLSRDLGAERTRVLVPPVKIDDALLEDPSLDLDLLLRGAVRYD